MITILTVGFVLGMAHALETDHLAAVASFSVRGKSAREILKLGVSWGLGHTITLFLTVVPLFLLGMAISETVEARLEAFVGAVLVFLGLRLIWKLWKERVHVHVHKHDDGVQHSHVHSHKDEPGAHAQSDHAHTHKRAISWPSMLVGLIHGAAGSAALLLYVTDAAPVKWMVVPLVLLFGLGSVLGMALVSQIIVIPLKLAQMGKAWVFPALQHVAALAAISVGAMFIFNGLA
jgi:ABC-type nickel/cobalt efflux system permease component RcnA